MLQVSALPIELLHEIIALVWESDVLPDERIQFMTASRLVSKPWSSIYENIASSDLHIPCENFYQYLFNDATPSRDFSKVKRITFVVYNDYTEVAPNYRLWCEFMRCFGTVIVKLTSLRAIRMDYHDSYDEGLLQSNQITIRNLALCFPQIYPSTLSGTSSANQQ